MLSGRSRRRRGRRKLFTRNDEEARLPDDHFFSDASESQLHLCPKPLYICCVIPRLVSISQVCCGAGAWARIPAVRRGASTPRFQEVETSARISRGWSGGEISCISALSTNNVHRRRSSSPRPLGYRRYRD